jgi:PEP-CTERM motif
MRLKSALVVLSLSVFSIVPRHCFADTLTLLSTSGGSTAGVDTYPYQFTVTGPGGSDTNVNLSCLNFNREITFGETWTVDVYSVLAIPPSALDGFTDQQFLADALLDNQYAAAAGNATLTSEIQFAIWSVMDPTDINPSNPSYNVAGAFDATASGLASAALADANTAPASDFANDVAFIPDLTNQTGWTDGVPQIFMADSVPSAVTPEPAALILVGSGVLGTLVIMRRRLRNA